MSFRTFQRFTLGHFWVKIHVTWNNAILQQAPKKSPNILPLENLGKALFVELVVSYTIMHLFESAKGRLLLIKSVLDGNLLFYISLRVRSEAATRGVQQEKVILEVS